MKNSLFLPIMAILGMTVLVLFGCAAKSTAKKDPPPAYVSQEFALTMADLRKMVSDMPGSIRQSILEKPKTFLESLQGILQQPAIYTRLVDKQHALPTGYAPTDLVRLAHYGLSVSRESVELRKSIMPEVMAMVDAARADHILLLFSSTYRSYETQQVVYSREVQLYGKKVADSESAVPGHSQHQMGTTVDFGCICNDFAKTAAYKWLIENAWKYGFSLTYPNGYEKLTGYRFEPWHWHYITRAGTAVQREYFDDIQQYLLVFLNDNRDVIASAYRGSNLGQGWESNGSGQ